MARLPYAPSTHRDADHPLNLFRMLAHSPPVLAGFAQLGGALLLEGTLEPRLRELAILRVGLCAGAAYEVGKHTRIAKKVGVTADEIAALRPGADQEALDDAARAVVAFTDASCESARVDDATFERARRHLDDRQLVELVVTVGYYALVCRVLETLEVDPESKPAGATSAGARA